LLNFGHLPQHLALPAHMAQARLLLSTALDREGEFVHAGLELRPAEGVILLPGIRRGDG